MKREAMIVACHQPNFLPWIGLFYKVLRADQLVLLDEVQFARGFSWVNRNRLKNEQGELWLTLPVMKKGRGFQRINEVEIFNERPWPRKHLQSIIQNYAHAPYLEKHLAFLKNIYQHKWKKLIDLNLELLKYLFRTLGIKKEFVLQSQLAVDAQGSQLIIEVCKKMGATTYLAPQCSRKYLNELLFPQNDLILEYYNFIPPTYPQLWGNFIPNLSILDLLCNCGEKSLEIIKKYNETYVSENSHF